MFTRSAAAPGAVRGATVEGTVLICPEGGTSVEGKFAERPGKAVLGTTGGSAAGTPELGTTGSVGLGDDNADGVGLAGKRLKVFKFKSTNSSEARFGP